MVKKKRTRAKPATNGVRSAKVGDRVEIIIGTRRLVGEVVEDRGHIGVNGRQAVHVAVRTEQGEVEKFDWPVEELTILHTATAGA